MGIKKIKKNLKTKVLARKSFGEDHLYFVSLLFFLFLITDLNFFFGDHMPYTIIAVVVALHGIYNAFHKKPMTKVLKHFSTLFVLLFDMLACLLLLLSSTEQILLSYLTSTEPGLNIHDGINYFFTAVILYNMFISYLALETPHVNVNDGQMGDFYTLAITIYVVMGFLMFKFNTEAEWFQIYAFMLFLFPIVMTVVRYLYFKINGWEKVKK